jgi:flavodoxin short chain
MTNIVYASMTGNTEEIANKIKDGLEEKGSQVNITEVGETSFDEFKNGDTLIVATYTYGDGDLPDEIQDFYNEIEGSDLSGKKYGVIGSGDTSYGENFCKAVETFDEALSKAGADKATDNVKIEFEANDTDAEAIEKFISDLA